MAALTFGDVGESALGFNPFVSHEASFKDVYLSIDEALLYVFCCTVLPHPRSLLLECGVVAVVLSLMGPALLEVASSTS